MLNFTAFNPTRLHFGKDCLQKIGPEARQYGQKALILIGKGSVKQNGTLKRLTDQLDQAAIEWTVFEGIKSNPEYQKADEAVQKARSFGADMLIALGGGSVIDTAKAVSAGFYVDHSVWDFYQGKGLQPQAALPLLVVLTLAATGTEMNRFTVLQDTAAQQKRGWGHELLYPKSSYLDPEFTYTVPVNYTAYGVADMLAHTFELYFSKDKAPLSDLMATDIVRLGFEYGPLVVAQPHNYEARANILWLSTMALNGSLQAGKRSGDFGVHSFEHVLSVLFDIPHGAGLSIVYPAWMKHFYNEIEEKLNFLAYRTLGEGKTGRDFIQALEDFYDQIDTPKRLQDWGIGIDQHAQILKTLEANKVKGAYFEMKSADYKALLALMT
jgi:alcohol dehydrogenase YqhD (iron-dependent ADH family)